MAVVGQNLQTGLDPLFPDSYSINEKKKGRPYMNSWKIVTKLLKFSSLSVLKSNVFVWEAPGLKRGMKIA